MRTQIVPFFRMFFLWPGSGAEMEHKLLEHKLFPRQSYIKKQKTSKIENVHEMGRRGSKINIKYTKMIIFLSRSSWRPPFWSKPVFLSIFEFFFVWFFVAKKFVFVFLFGSLSEYLFLIGPKAFSEGGPGGVGDPWEKPFCVVWSLSQRYLVSGQF